MGPFLSADKAVAAFEKKFYDKTKNQWAQRAKFMTNKQGHGKYTMIEVGDDDEEDLVRNADTRI